MGSDWRKGLVCDCCSGKVTDPRDPYDVEHKMFVVSFNGTRNNNTEDRDNQIRSFHSYCFHHFVVGDSRFEKIPIFDWKNPVCYCCGKEPQSPSYSITVYDRRLGYGQFDPCSVLDFCYDCFAAMAGEDFFTKYKHKKVVLRDFEKRI